MVDRRNGISGGTRSRDSGADSSLLGSGLRLRKSTAEKDEPGHKYPAISGDGSKDLATSATKHTGRYRLWSTVLACVILGLCLWGWERWHGEWVLPSSSVEAPPATIGGHVLDSRQKPTLLNVSNCTRAAWTPPFRTRGRHIVDARNQRVKLTSVNWYGASDIYQIPSGLDVQHRDNISALIWQLGFNSVRLPYSDEMVRYNPYVAPELLAANRDLMSHSQHGARALDVFTAVVESLTAAGLLVIINNHITQSTWCCDANPCDSGWANDWLGGICPVSQTEEEWIDNWETIMQPFVSNPMVIGTDLRNEVRGLWGTMTWERWAMAAEKAAERLLELNPNWLMIVEGVSSANDLSGVRKRPIQLSQPDRVVYSAHVYSWSGWGSLYPFSKRPYKDFIAAMNSNWGYLLAGDLAPVWVGEFGTPDKPKRGDQNYWNNLIRYLEEVDTSWGYWAINPRKPQGNEWEGYGLVGDGWDEGSIRWDYRLRDLKQLGLGCS